MSSEILSEIAGLLAPGEKSYSIATKVLSGERINAEEGTWLYYHAGTGLLGVLANAVRERINGNKVFFVRNFHIEPTNKCIYNCKFCSYSEKLCGFGWDLSHDEMLAQVAGLPSSIMELHIVGGVHPDHDLEYYGTLLAKIKAVRPDIHIKAFSAVEIEHMIRKSRLSLREGLSLLREYGLDSIPGGGAEIFDEEIREIVCKDKTSSSAWLQIHKTAHELGIPTNATILYGHIEKFEHRIDHMQRLRDLQDITRGFNAFIPLKFKMSNNELTHLGEVPLLEDLRNFAVSRIFLDNIPHLKAYWPMTGRQGAQLAISFGVDDIDGTIQDSTKIYSLAGSEEQNPSMTAEEMITMIRQSRNIAVERDALYREINVFN